MTQGLYTAISGIKNFQSKMNVISDNVANMNTVGFKSSQVNFENLFSRTLSSGFAPLSDIGGTNPMQVGLGVTIGEISRDFTNGTVQTTGKSTDLSISGNGFFTLADSNGEIKITRAGNFSVDTDGSLNSTQGMRVLGTTDISTDTAGTTPIRIPPALKLLTIGNSTAAVKTVASLNNVNIATGSFTVGATLEGASTSVSSTFTLEESSTMRDVVSMINTWARTDTSGNGLGLNYNIASIGNDGKFDFAYADADLDGLTFGASTDTSNLLTETKLATSTAISDGTNTSLESKIIDYRAIIGLADPTDQTVERTSYSIGRDGAIEVSYQNADKITVTGDDTRSLLYRTSTGVEILSDDITVESNAVQAAELQLQMASIVNPKGLLSEGGNVFALGPNAGQPIYSIGQTGGFGEIEAGSLESSNVDLPAEFAELVISQRALSANSRVFSTQSQIMSEIVNLSR